MSVEPPLPCAPGTDWAHALQRPAEVSRGQTRLLVAAMAALHLGAGWALMQVPAVRQAVLEAVPMTVEFLAAPVPRPPAPALPAPALPTAPTPALPPQVQPRPAAVLAAPSPALPPAQAYTASAPPTTPAEPVAEAQPAPALAAAAAPPAPAPPARREVPATAVRYRVQPPVEVPLASRRAGESGVVWLRVVVDARGLPAQVRVQRSSGHPRLDEQALWAMRQARFQPHTQDGTAIEVEVVAPIDYPLE